MLHRTSGYFHRVSTAPRLRFRDAALLALLALAVVAGAAALLGAIFPPSPAEQAMGQQLYRMTMQMTTRGMPR